MDGSKTGRESVGGDWVKEEKLKRDCAVGDWAIKEGEEKEEE